VHNKKHRCSSTTWDKRVCPPEGGSDAWVTTDEEFIKFGARLLYGKVGNSRDLILEKYKKSWEKLHPNTEVPLTSSGEPIDFLWDPKHPCSEIPWLGDIPQSAPLTGTILIFKITLSKSLIFSRATSSAGSKAFSFTGSSH
jgi:hypothetical protein